MSTAEVHIQYLQTEKATIEQQRAQAVAQLATANSNVETLLQDKLTLFEENDKLKAQVALLTQGSAAKEDSSLQHDTFDDADGDTDEGPLDMDTISMMNQQQKQKEQVKKQVEAPKNPAEYDNHHSESSHNITYLSYSGDSSLCKVRKTLEQERKARQQRHQADAAGKADVSCVHDEEHVGAKASEEQTRECSESSVIKRPKRAATPRDELTSGFIIPDITFNQQRMTEAQASLELPANTQPQSGIVQQDTFHGHTERSDILSYSPVLPVEQQPVQQAAEPRQLPPVSDEELDITIHDEEPTIRPTQPPDVALATVLDSLHAELAAQRAEVAKYQASYDRHDVSISRRQRKQIIGKIQALLQSCEVKADQIYNLHDVIEGHKQRGQPISQYQIDNTLQSLGLDLPWEGLDSRRRSIASSRSI